MSRFLIPQYASLEAYVPGEQPRDRRYIKLNTNESPYPPSPEVVAAVSADAVRDLRLYSDPECRDLKKALADRYGLSPKNVYLANGSDDILNFAFMAFCDRETGAAFPEITYGFYRVFAALHGVPALEIPLREDFSIDYRDYRNIGRTVVIANPNAPTGLSLPLSSVEEIVKSNPGQVVVVDEAYVDFGGETALPLLEKYDNLLIVRTFSKSRSLAGARLGFAFASEELISDLETLRYSTNPYNVNRLTLLAGEAAIRSDDYFTENCRKIMKTRDWVSGELKALGFTVLPSCANFLFASTPRMSGEDFYLGMKERGVLVRHFSNPKISDFNRITVGSEEEMEIFVREAGALQSEGRKGQGR